MTLKFNMFCIELNSIIGYGNFKKIVFYNFEFRGNNLSKIGQI